MKKFISILTALTFAAALTVGSSAMLFLGDVNKDEKVNSTDALSILRYIVGLDVGGNFDRAAADINGDGAINSADALSVLRITVGLEKTYELPSEKQEILSFYNSALDKTYAKTTEIEETVTDDYGLWVDIPVTDEGQRMNFGPDTYNYFFTDGLDEYGNAPEDIAPNSLLTEEMIKQISIKKIKNGYEVNLELWFEEAGLSEVPEIQYCGGVPFYYINDETDDFEYNGGQIMYIGTKVTAFINEDGYVESFDVYVPYESYYSILFDYEGDIYKSEIAEIGYRQHHFDIITTRR